MGMMLAKLLTEMTAQLRGRVVGLLGFLGAANFAAWAAALIAFHNNPVLLGTALLAYSFGLRHAVDADHIAAIDNATRKLMQEGKRPVALGFFFSLGHSTVVVLAAMAIALTAGVVRNRFPMFRELGGMIGTSVSALFLMAVAAANLIILSSVYRSFRRVRCGAALDTAGLDDVLTRRGLLGRIFRPLFRLIGKSWHMYFLGLLFGLGFDTASEIGLLGIAATEASKGLSLWATLVFPGLFTAGMALVDTADSVLMVGAYGWAFAKPIRKLYYNLTITFISVLVAFIVGGIEALGLIAEKLDLEGPFWRLIAQLNANFGSLGYLIVAIFVVSWLASVMLYRLKRYDEIEVTGR
jgi:nickel/cobalt transporter (NiCoT) family protein